MNHIKHLEELLGMLHEERYRYEKEVEDGSAPLNAVWRRIREYEAELEALKVAQGQGRSGKGRD
jgi:hypothetical protein